MVQWLAPNVSQATNAQGSTAPSHQSAVARWATRQLGVGLSSNALNELQWYLFSVVFLLAMYWEYAATGVFSAWSDAVVGALEIASIAVLCLVFFAPAAYHRWLDRTPATTGAAAR